MKKIFIYISILLLTSCNVAETFGLKKKKGSKKSGNPSSIVQKECNGPYIKTINMPIDHENKDRGVFTYTFQHIVIQGATSTIIEIPGGPGQDGIDLDPDLEELIAKNYNYIYIDPRGLGCNYFDESTLKDDVVTTPQHAKDIIQIAKYLNLDSYAIHGISYGTVVVTEISHLLNEETDGVTPPKAFVMEGVVGKVEASSDYYERFVKQWESLQIKVSGLKDAFSNNNSLPLGLSHDQWNSVVETFISLGDPYASYYLMVAIDPERFAPEIVEVTKRVISNLLADEYSYTGSERFYDLVGCKEIFDINDEFISLTEGDLEVFKVVNFLGAGESLDDVSRSCSTIDLNKPFDASNFKMLDIPTYYFHGENDPNTSLEGARYHYDVQSHLTNRHLIVTGDAGHNPLTLQLSDCHGALWRSIFAGSSPRESRVVDGDGKCGNGSMSLSGIEEGKIKNIEPLRINYLKR